MCFNPFIDHIFINDASQLMEAEQSQFQSQEELRMQIKTAGYIAGLQGKQVVLFIPEGLDPNAMKDICSLMAEGVWSLSKKATCSCGFVLILETKRLYRFY